MKAYFTAAMVFLFGVSLQAQPLAAHVESSADGEGWFTYTFSRGEAPYVWGIDPVYGAIQMQSYGVLEIVDPPGWTHTLSSTDEIQWRTTDQIRFLDEPVTFRLRSCLTLSTQYRGLGPGFILGAVFALPGRTNYLAGGYEVFEFVGPARTELKIERFGTNITVSWPTNAGSLVLEGNAKPSDPSGWVEIAATGEESSRHLAQIPATDPARFFRLRSPSAK